MSRIKNFFKKKNSSDSEVNLERENLQLKEQTAHLDSRLQALEKQLTKTEAKLRQTKMKLNDRQPIGRLPDLCLLALLKQMTPEDQIRASKVCTRWSVLVPEATQTKRRLSILLGTGELADYEQLFMEQPWMHSSLLKHITDDRGQPLFPYRRLTPWNTLRLQYLSDDLISLITSTFAGIKELQVAAYGSCTTTANDTLIDLRNLLSQWRHDLIAFKLAERSREVGDPFFIKMSNSAIAAFYSALNSMTTLQCLSIRLNDMPLLDLPILSRLKEFHFDSRNPKLQSWDALLATLEKHTKENSGLSRIAFGEGVFFGDPQQNLTSLSDGLCNRFTRLDSAISLHNLFAVGLQFRQLTSLHTADKPYRYLLNQLSNLPSLSHLCLSINFKNYLEYSTAKFKSPPADDQPPPDCPLPQLHTVKSLHLQLVTLFSHKAIVKLNLPWTMPQLQVLQLEPGNRCKCFNCRVGELNYADILISRDGPGGRCLRQVGAPLKRDCAKLKAIFFTWAGRPPVELL